MRIRIRRCVNPNRHCVFLCTWYRVISYTSLALDALRTPPAPCTVTEFCAPNSAPISVFRECGRIRHRKSWDPAETAALVSPPAPVPAPVPVSVPVPRSDIGPEPTEVCREQTAINVTTVHMHASTPTANLSPPRAPHAARTSLTTLRRRRRTPRRSPTACRSASRGTRRRAPPDRDA